MASGGLESTGFVAVEPKLDCPHVKVSYTIHNILVKLQSF